MNIHINNTEGGMNIIVKGGLRIGILCAIWTFAMGFSGWYRDPAMLMAFYAVILIQLGVLVWGLKQTAAQGRTYGGQVAAGTLMSVVGGVIIILSSFLFTLVVFPNYFEEIRVVQQEMLKAAGKTDAEIAAEVEMAAQFQTPVMQAIFGFIGTVFTGLIGSLIIGAFYRKK